MNKVDIPALAKILAQRESIKDPALVKHFDKAIANALGLPVIETRMRVFAFYGVLGLFFFFALATGLLAILATLKLVTVETTAMGWLWGAFMVNLAPNAFWLIKHIWGKTE